MWTLGLETASSQGSVTLLDGDEPVLTAVLPPRQYTVALLPAMHVALDKHGLMLGDLALIGVADGPGSFTGVRIGLATVKAIMEVLATPVVAVSTLAAVAAAAGVDAPVLAAPVLAVMDAGRGAVYSGIYANGVSTGEETVEPAADFAAKLAAWNDLAATPDAALAALWPRLQKVDPLLARHVARLARLPGATRADVLTLDARYLGQRWK